MTHLKFPNQIESEIHQTLGAEKIEEICDRHQLQDGGKELLDKVLLSLKLDDLFINKNLVAEIINQIAAGRPEKETIKKIVDVIAELFIFAKKAFLASSKGRLERSLECQSAY